MARFLLCLLLVLFTIGPILAQEDSSETTEDTSSDEKSDRPKFRVPQKAFGMGLVNSNAEVVANAMERALNKDRPQLVRRGLGFYVLITRKRGNTVDKDAVTQTLSQASDILKGRGYEESKINKVLSDAQF